MSYATVIASKDTTISSELHRNSQLIASGTDAPNAVEENRHGIRAANSIPEMRYFIYVAKKRAWCIYAHAAACSSK